MTTEELNREIRKDSAVLREILDLVMNQKPYGEWPDFLLAVLWEACRPTAHCNNIEANKAQNLCRHLFPQGKPERILPPLPFRLPDGEYRRAERVRADLADLVPPTKKRITDVPISELAELAAQAGREAVAESRRLGLLPPAKGNGRHIIDLTMEERAALFAQAGREAVARSRSLGLPVTGMKNGRIVRIYPDGREEVLDDIMVKHSVGLGWEPVVYRLVESLRQLPEPPEIRQIKQKWGQLRVYLASYLPEEEALIEEAQAEAARTCELCGQPGELRQDLPWAQVLCEDHYKDQRR